MMGGWEEGGSRCGVREHWTFKKHFLESPQRHVWRRASVVALHSLGPGCDPHHQHLGSSPATSPQNGRASKLSKAASSGFHYLSDMLDATVAFPAPACRHRGMQQSTTTWRHFSMRNCLNQPLAFEPNLSDAVSSFSNASCTPPILSCVCVPRFRLHAHIRRTGDREPSLWKLRKAPWRRVCVTFTSTAVGTLIDTAIGLAWGPATSTFLHFASGR
ncbi:hypothetical protein EX30DRAFT_191047 [Ascodesmis nigricans]|uniref:Uncharacterized protein n=1 Tax=Ascodesmis nigricans TaxID=341454 RepID=A0A4S2N0G7_9PEZI|nr:hypothetical protein EX30DRAFT_191047 [Ascodesmis nigricans]